MSKKYLLAISDVVHVPVWVKIADGEGKEKDYKFSLVCNRLGAEDQAEKFGVLSPRDFLMQETTGWSGQRLVLNDDKTPADFCEDAFAAMLDIQGLTIVAFNAYMKAVNAVEKT
jgi:hypothetical protein